MKFDPKNYHHSLPPDFSIRWSKLSLMEQLGNVGSEVERALNWQKKGNKEQSLRAGERMLELLDFTIADERWRYRLKEITRTREVLCDYFWGDNDYHTSAEFLHKYFLYFGIAARM